nr:hypothetical protein CFP56_67612 [Quercus suber]
MLIGDEAIISSISLSSGSRSQHSTGLLLSASLVVAGCEDNLRCSACSSTICNSGAGNGHLLRPIFARNACSKMSPGTTYPPATVSYTACAWINFDSGLSISSLFFAGDGLSSRMAFSTLLNVICQEAFVCPRLSIMIGDGAIQRT